jgi:hypothetical protein
MLPLYDFLQGQGCRAMAAAGIEIDEVDSLQHSHCGMRGVARSKISG